MKLSPHFNLAEFTRSETAARHRIDNTPPPQCIDNLHKVAMLLEDVRKLLGEKSIYVTSGYRCSKLNKLIGSKPSSGHVNGLAVDFVCPSFGTPKEIAEAVQCSNLEWDQCILEYYNPVTGNGWVHLGLNGKPRKQVLTINEHGVFSGIHV